MLTSESRFAGTHTKSTGCVVAARMENALAAADQFHMGRKPPGRSDPRRILGHSSPAQQASGLTDRIRRWRANSQQKAPVETTGRARLRAEVRFQEHGPAGAVSATERECSRKPDAYVRVLPVSVEGTSYCWHQPDHLAIFEYEVTTDSSTGNPSEDFEKPITLSKTNLPPPRICCGGFCSKRPN